MRFEDIKAKIKQIIYETTNIDPSDIGDDASFRKDLDLDSLTLLEIGVNVDQEFDLDMPDEEMDRFTSVTATARIVEEVLAVKVAH